MLPLPERLTHREAAATLVRLQTALADQPAGEPLVIDAAPLRHFDSSALVLLLGLHRDAAKRGLRCRLHAVPERLLQLAQVYGVLGLLDLDTAPASAA
jgi:phospholipid transport system transporter-binding protein